MTGIYQVSNYTPCQIGLVKGERGENGANGANGVNGKDGNDGQDGKDGLRGLSGSDGKSLYQIALDNGFVGTFDDYQETLRGEKGLKGDAGVDAAIDSLTVSTGAAGTSASVVTGGTPISRTFALTIPRGDKGDKGDGGSFLEKSYKTYAEMELDKPNLTANISTRVSNDSDTAKNGSYTYDGTVFTRSQYDSKVVTDKIIADTAIAVQDAIRDVAIDANLVTDALIKTVPVASNQVSRSQATINAETITPYDYGAVGDRLSHPLSERFDTLAEAKVMYPHATSLSDEIDWCTLQAIFNKVRNYDFDLYKRSQINLSGHWQINKPLTLEWDGYPPSSMIVPTIITNFQLYLDNFESGQEYVWRIGATGLNFLGNVEFDVKKKAKYGLLTKANAYNGESYFPKGTMYPRCYINNAKLFNVYLEDSMFSTLPFYRGSGGGSGGRFFKDDTECTQNIVTIGDGYPSSSLLTVDKLPDTPIDTDGKVLVKIGNYYSKAVEVTGNDIKIIPHIPQSEGTTVEYIYGGGVFIGGGNSAGTTINSMSSLDAVGLHHQGLFSSNIDFICTEFTAVSIRDDGVVGGANIQLAYFEEDGAQYIRGTRDQGVFGGTTIHSATGLEIDKFHDIASGRLPDGRPVASLSTLKGMSVNIKGVNYAASPTRLAQNAIPTGEILDFSSPRGVLSILSNSQTISIKDVDENINSLFGYDSQTVVVVGRYANGVPATVGFMPPPNGQYKVNGSTTEVVFDNFKSAAVFECVVDYANKNIIVSLVSGNIEQDTRSPTELSGSITDANNIPADGYYYTYSTIANMPAATNGEPVSTTIESFYEVGAAGTANIRTQVLKYSNGDVWKRAMPSTTLVWGNWYLVSYKTRSGATASRPSNPQLGMSYYDTTLLAAGKPITWNGSAWVDALGVAV